MLAAAGRGESRKGGKKRGKARAKGKRRERAPAVDEERMRVLFTGASSFTGCWFARALAAAGHEVTVTLRSAPDAYEGLRKARIEQLKDVVSFAPDTAFGDANFMKLCAAEPHWDVLCHHAADGSDAAGEDFDPAIALASNTARLRGVLRALSEAGCRRVVLTGCLFEQDEGAGSQGLPAFSPLALSKGMTAQAFRYFAGRSGLHLGKFVAPLAFGPQEDPALSAALVRSWFAREPAQVESPAYVRDHIHVSLLAKAYVRFVTQLPLEEGYSRLGPSGYPESRGAFAERLAAAMRDRLALPCAVELAKQGAFPEPRVRINTDVLDAEALAWDESAAWDELAEYYRTTYGA